MTSTVVDAAAPSRDRAVRTGALRGLGCPGLAAAYALVTPGGPNWPMMLAVAAVMLAVWPDLVGRSGGRRLAGSCLAAAGRVLMTTVVVRDVHGDTTTVRSRPLLLDGGVLTPGPLRDETDTSSADGRTLLSAWRPAIG